jgi:ParB family chromosome partitioning protein
MGERRWRASRAAGLPTVPAIIRETPDDDLLRDALLENLHRQQLNPLEEAAAYEQLLREFGATHEELATRIGRSRSQVTNTLRLLGLPPSVQRRVAAGVLSAGHARALLALDDRESQERLAGRIVAEGLSVRAVEEAVHTAPVTDEPTAPRRSARVKPSAPGAHELAGRLSDRFETRVRVEVGRRKGKLTIEFGSLDDLQRIVGMIAPDLSTGDGEAQPDAGHGAEHTDHQEHQQHEGEHSGHGGDQHHEWHG